MRRVAALVVLLSSASCVRESTARSHLEDKGYTAIELTSQGGGAWTFRANNDDGAQCSGRIELEGVDAGCARKLSQKVKSSCTKETVHPER